MTAFMNTEKTEVTDHEDPIDKGAKNRSRPEAEKMEELIVYEGESELLDFVFGDLNDFTTLFDGNSNGNALTFFFFFVSFPNT